MPHVPTPERDYPTPCDRRDALAGARAGLALALALCLAACVDASWPFHRHETTARGAATGDTGSGSSDSECADIRAQIRTSEEQRREAPATSTNPEIVNASLAKADKRIEDLRSRYAELDCPPEKVPQPGRVPPLPPAPGAAH